MDVADDIGAGDGEDVAVVEDVLVVVGKAGASGVAFFESVGADGGAHRAVQDEDSFGEGFLEI